MITKDTINFINTQIYYGFRFFYFDRKFRLISSSINTIDTGSFYDLNTGIEIYIKDSITIEDLEAKLRYYNTIL